MLDIQRLDTATADFQTRFNKLLAVGQATESEVRDRVAAIVADVRARGDQALLEYTRQFDGFEVARASELEIPHTRLQTALDALPAAQRQALETAAERLTAY